MIIRQAVAADYPAIYQLVQQAFKTAQVSDGTEQDFVEALRKSPGFLPELEFVAEENGELIGHVMLTKRGIETVTGEHGILLLAPLSVAFAHRNQEIGGRLMQTAFDKALTLDHTAVFLVGNPDYYKRYGFHSAADFGITNGTEIPDEFVLGIELVPDTLKDVAGTLHIE